MVNLGVASSNASASDLITRDSYDGGAVRQTLIVREDGKAPTQFVSGRVVFSPRPPPACRFICAAGVYA